MSPTERLKGCLQGEPSDVTLIVEAAVAVPAVRVSGT
jgi:hypothetical protein